MKIQHTGCFCGRLHIYFHFILKAEEEAGVRGGGGERAGRRGINFN